MQPIGRGRDEFRMMNIEVLRRLVPSVNEQRSDPHVIGDPDRAFYCINEQAAPHLPIAFGFVDRQPREQ